MEIPQKFIKWAFEDRGELIRKLRDGDDISRDELFLGFTRHTPTIVTNGKTGPNGSVKGVGFLPQDDYLDVLLEAFMAQATSEYDDGFGKRGLELLHEMVWTKPDRMKLDHLATIDMALNQTWQNIQDYPIASILFYQPPIISFELKCDVIVHKGDKIHQLVNAQHDVYHKPDRSVWDKRIVYEFVVNKIYDKSATKAGFGKLIWER